MNLVEKLIRIDKDKAKEKETKKIKSKRLSKLLGEDTEITIQEIGGRRLNEITAMCINEEGKKDFAKMYETNLMYCVEGIIEPSMKDKTLMEHFGVATPDDLAAILFGTESSQIANEIVILSGLGEDSEKKIKN